VALLNVEIPLDRRPFLPPDRAPVAYCRQVAKIVQPNTSNWCWAACIAAECSRVGAPRDIFDIAAARRNPGCPRADCWKMPIPKCCNRRLNPEELKAAWAEFGFRNLEYRPGTMLARQMEDQLAQGGPVQVFFGDLHAVMLDRWVRGPFNTISVWLMDPIQGDHFHMQFENLVTNPDGDYFGAWSGSIVGLPNNTAGSASCPDPGPPPANG
jgi:hypothetical protein